MTLALFVTASAAGSLGAVLRYLTTGVIQERWPSDLPVGTIAVNLVGSLALGLVLGAGDPGSFPTIAAVGLLGGFTTFSTWMTETLGLGPRSHRAAINLALTLVGGVAVAALGYGLVG